MLSDIESCLCSCDLSFDHVDSFSDHIAFDRKRKYENQPSISISKKFVLNVVNVIFIETNLLANDLLLNHEAF